MSEVKYNDKAGKVDGKCWGGSCEMSTGREPSLKRCYLNKDLKEGDALRWSLVACVWPGRGAARWGLESEAEMGDEVRLGDLLVLSWIPGLLHTDSRQVRWKQGPLGGHSIIRWDGGGRVQRGSEDVERTG